MIVGRADTWFTVAEFAAMVGRCVKTLENWRSEGRIQFVSLCGVQLVALSHVESLITGTVPAGAADGVAALRMMNRTTRDGRRTAKERRRPRVATPNNRLTPAGTISASAPLTDSTAASVEESRLQHGEV